MGDSIFERGLLDAVMSAIDEGVSVIDREFKIVYQNDTMLRLYGSRIGERCHAVYRDSGEPCAECLVQDVLRDGKVRVAVCDIQLADGGALMIEHSLAPLRDAQGAIAGFVELARDVTEKARLSQECRTLRQEMVRQAQFENIITQSKRMKAVFRVIERVASTASTVLITGESGTGKELIARAIFANSDRRDRPYVSLNCGAIPENLLEAELFGHAKGAYTGAVKDRQGLLETADKGTLFLDEVGELPLALQVKLLRFLQEGEVRRVGETRVRNYDVRIVCATNRDLDNAVRGGEFREDLFFRLNVIPVFLPPLRERSEDILLLANHFLRRLCRDYQREVKGIASHALKALLDYSWPGNVRELENAIEYAIHLTEEGKSIQPAQLPPKIAGPMNALQEGFKPLSIAAYTKQTILSLQAEHGEEEIALKLGISRKNLWEKRKRFGIPRPAPAK
jgi:transcriptional regulator with PAS, ATPase and Fis domain